MKLSIIIPVYCTAHTLDRCLQSIVGQSFRDFEVIVVDDGSPDDSAQLCDRWASEDARISVVHQPNGGLSAARNAGIERARGEYITFVDSDDYIGDNTLGDVVARLGDNDLVEYPLWRFYGAPHQQLLSFADETYTNASDYWLQGKAYSHTYACNKVFRRALFRDVRFPEGRLFEDVYTLPLILRRVRRLATISSGMYYYCWNQGGITATAGGNGLRQLLDACLASGMPMDDSYYLHVLNIQLDVSELTGDDPLLPYRRVRLAGGFKQMVKSIMNNLLGVKRLCNAIRLIHLVKPPSRS